MSGELSRHPVFARDPQQVHCDIRHDIRELRQSLADSRQLGQTRRMWTSFLTRRGCSVERAFCVY